MTGSTMDVGLTGCHPRRPDPRPGPRRHEAVRWPRGGQQRRLRHPADVDRLADRPERGGQDDVLQHDHRRLRPDHRRDRVRRPPDRLHEGQEGPLAQAPRGHRAGHRADVPEHPAVRRRCPPSTTSGPASTSTSRATGGTRSCARRPCSTRRSTRSTRACACSSSSVSSARPDDLGAQPAVRRPAPARDRPSPRDAAEAPPARRADRRHERQRDARDDRLHPQASGRSSA